MRSYALSSRSSAALLGPPITLAGAAAGPLRTNVIQDTPRRVLVDTISARGRSTRCHPGLCESPQATKRRYPCAAPASSNLRASAVPMPWRCQASATTKPSSAWSSLDDGQVAERDDFTVVNLVQLRDHGEAPRIAHARPAGGQGSPAARAHGGKIGDIVPADSAARRTRAR